MKRTTKPSSEVEQEVKDFIDQVPTKVITRKVLKPKRVRVPHTKEGGIDWSKFLTNGEVLTERPEGMPFHVYKQLLYDQKWKLKMRKRV